MAALSAASDLPVAIRLRWLEPAGALVAAVIAAAVVLIATAPHGPRVSTDSVFYLSTADNLREGRGLTTFQGTPLVNYAPGFAVAVAIAEEAAGDRLLAARIVNAVCLAAIVILGWALLRIHVGSVPLRLAGVAGIASAPVLFAISSAALSDSLFLSLVLGSALALERSFERPRSRGWVVLAGVLVAGCFLVRYIGAALIMIGGLVLLAANRRALSLAERVRRTALFGLVAAAPPALLLLRNLHLTGSHPFGWRESPTRSLADDASDAAVEFARWLAPGVPSVRMALAAVLVAAVGAWAVSGDRRPRPPRAPLWPLVALAAGYVAFLLASASVAWLNPLGARLLSPAFVPVVVLAFASLDRLLSLQPRRWLTGVVAAVVLLWLCAEAVATRADLRYLRREGSGFTERRWRDSTLVSLVRTQRPAPAFSNWPDAVFFLTSVHARCWPTPGPSLCHRGDPEQDLRRAGRPGYLAWFAEPGAERPMLPPRLARTLRVVQVARTEDGGLYRVRLVAGRRRR